MTQPVRILYVDDYPLDRELVRDALEKEDGGFELVEAASRLEFETALAQGHFDLVLSDFNILGFEGLQVLEAVHAKVPDLPVIIVTGTGSEEIAVEAIKRGAADYVIKTPKHIQRLPHTVHSVLEKKRLEDERGKAHAMQAYLASIVETSDDAIISKTLEGIITSWNRGAQQLYGYSADETIGQPVSMLIPPDRPDELPEILSKIGRGEGVKHYEIIRVRNDGTHLDVSLTVSPIRDGSRQVIGASSIARDITERKRTEARIKQQVRRLSVLRAIDTAILSTVDLHLSLNILLAQAINELQVDAAAVLLLNNASNELVYANGTGFRSGGIAGLRQKPGEGYAGQAILERRSVIVPDRSLSARLYSSPRLIADEKFVAFFAVPLVAKGQVKGVLELFHRSRLDPEPEWLDFLETLAGQAAIAIDSMQTFTDLQRSNVELSLAYDATIEGWSQAMDLRDKETEGHTRRVTEMAITLSRAMGLSEGELVHVRWGALLHDIGKMGVPDVVLLKPGSLTEDEWVLMKRHPTLAHEMLAKIRYLESAINIPYCHHEKWDGTGYPRGLKGEQIPLTARIFAVVDVWDALTSDRPYRPAWSHEKAIEYIRSQAGSHFDPEVVKVCLNSEIFNGETQT